MTRNSFAMYNARKIYYNRTTVQDIITNDIITNSDTFLNDDPFILHQDLNYLVTVTLV